MAHDFYGFDDDEPAQGRDHLFLWTVFILLLIGAAFACWLGSFYVFGHPEQPRSYAILKKLKKIEPLRRFEVTAAPPGEFLTPQKLFDKYSKFERLNLEAENAALMRNFIRNYKETNKLVPYVTGKFEIVQTYELKPGDLFPSGVVAVAAADDYSRVVLEHVFTAAPESVEALKATMPPGREMRLEKSRDLAAIIHIDRTDDGRMLFTAMPLLYGAWGVERSIGRFSLEPPTELNLKASVPIIGGPAFLDVMKSFAALRHEKPLIPGTEGAPSVSKAPELVRLETPPGDVPATGALPDLPEEPVATPIPVATPRGRGPAVAVRNIPKPIIPGLPVTPPPRLAMNPPPAAPPPALPPTAVAPPPMVRGTPALVSPSGVPLKPFISSAVPTGGGNWRTYTRGQQPPGRTITPAEASAMADRGGELPERLYLRGDFVVTASGDNRAVLRAPSAPGDVGRNGTGAARIIVEFPPSSLPPAEGSTLSRDENEGFEVREVRRGGDGQINIYVREITRG